MNTLVPFFKNSPDGIHCFQAVIKMLLKYYYPNEDYSLDELDKITGKKEGLWTWQMACAVWLQNKGLMVKDIEIFDYERFIAKKEEYLIEFFGEEAGKEQIKFSDVNQEVCYSQEFIKKIDIQIRIPDSNDIKNLLKEGYLLVITLNQQILNNLPGYVGHFVLVTGYDEDNIIFHDPGLPEHENREETFTHFEKAWAYPNEKVKNILAFKQT